MDKEKGAGKGLSEAYGGDLPWWFRLVNTMYLHLGTDGDSLFVFRCSVGSIGHIHYPMGSTIPGDTQTVAKLPDEGSPIGAYSRGRFRLLLCFAFFKLFFIYFDWVAEVEIPFLFRGEKIVSLI